MYLFVYIYVCVCIYWCIFVYEYKNIYLYIYIYLFIRIYKYTFVVYTHILAQSLGRAWALQCDSFPSQSPFPLFNLHPAGKMKSVQLKRWRRIWIPTPGKLYFQVGRRKRILIPIPVTLYIQVGQWRRNSIPAPLMKINLPSSCWCRQSPGICRIYVYIYACIYGFEGRDVWFPEGKQFVLQFFPTDTHPERWKPRHPGVASVPYTFASCQRAWV